MDVPVYIGGEEAGRLRAVQEGLYVRLTADCALRPGLTRLWLHSGDQSLYLGLLAPEGGRLRLEKRLSRRKVPETIACASDTEFVGAGTPGWPLLPLRGNSPPVLDGPPEPARSTNNGPSRTPAPTAEASDPAVGANSIRPPVSDPTLAAEQRAVVGNGPYGGGAAASRLLLPCSPRVPGAVELGGRHYLVISPPRRYNKKKP